MKKALIVSLCVIMCLSSGCLGAVQVDDYIYVVGIGFDKGADRRYNVSFLVQSSGTGDGQTQKGGAEVLAAEGDSFFEAVTAMHAGGPFRMDFSRVNTLFFSEELARMGELRELADLALNAIKLRQSVKLVVCLCEAKSFLQGLCVEDAPNMTKLQYSVFQNYAVEGITAVTDYAMLMESIRGGREDIVIMLGGIDPSAVQSQKKESGELSSKENSGGEQEKEKDKKQQDHTTAGVQRIGGMSSYIDGVALFDGWYMKGVLSGSDTRFLLMAQGKFDRANIKLKYQENDVMLGLEQKRAPKIKLELGDMPNAYADIKLTCNILQYKDKNGKEAWEQGLKTSAEEYIEAELNRVFSLCQEMNSDAIGFGRCAVMKFGSTGAWEEYRWKERYPTMNVEFNVELEPGEMR